MSQQMTCRVCGDPFMSNEQRRTRSHDFEKVDEEHEATCSEQCALVYAEHPPPEEPAEKPVEKKPAKKAAKKRAAKS